MTRTDRVTAAKAYQSAKSLSGELLSRVQELLQAMPPADDDSITWQDVRKLMDANNNLSAITRILSGT